MERRAITGRDVESDLALAKSYSNSFGAAKVRLAGTRITDDLPTVTIAVKALMPIDDDTPAILAILENAIAAAYDDINGIADKWDAYLIQVAIALQRHVPFYQIRQIMSVIEATAGLTTEGFISRIALPEGARLQQVTFGRRYDALEPDVALAVDDIVISNGRAYKVIVGGTLTVYDIGAGLTSTDGEDEILGDLTFQYYTPERDWPCRPFEWTARNRIFSGDFSGGSVYSIPPQFDEIWLYPKLDADHRFDLEWVGVVETFEDVDEVTFDRTAAEAAAHFIKSRLYQSELDDVRNSAASDTLYQLAMRKAVVDNLDRETGSPTQVQPYDYRRRCWAWGNCCGIVTQNSNNSTEVNPNAWNPVANTGGDTTLTPTAANQSYTVTFTGAADLRRIVIATHGMIAGNRVKLKLILPTTEGLIIDLRSGALAGPALLPEETFPDQLYTSDGLTTLVSLEFAFVDGEWEYFDHSIPA